MSASDGSSPPDGWLWTDPTVWVSTVYREQVHYLVHVFGLIDRNVDLSYDPISLVQ